MNFDVISSSADVSNKGNVASSRANDDDVRAAAPNGLADLQHSSTPGDALSGIVDTDAPSKDLQSELQNLRKRFDAVLEYTCHLTAERDSIVAQLKETKAKTDRQLARDSEKRFVSNFFTPLFCSTLFIYWFSPVHTFVISWWVCVSAQACVPLDLTQNLSPPMYSLYLDTLFIL